MPRKEREALAVRSKGLCVEQATLHNELIQRPRKLRDPEARYKSVFISYAWATSESKEQEGWIQPFVQQLYKELKAADVPVKMDEEDLRVGMNPQTFMRDGIERSQFVLVIASESLLQKHRGGTASICTELALLHRRRELDERLGCKEERSATVLVSGTKQTAIPEFLLGQQVWDVRELGYLGFINKLLQCLQQA